MGIYELIKKPDDKYTLKFAEGIEAIEDSLYKKEDIKDIVQKITEIILPDSIKDIYHNAFENFTEVENIQMSKNIKRIGKRAFSNCKNLKSIELPEGLYRIEEAAFGGCKGLREVTLPTTIHEIKKCLFDECSSLKKVNLHEDIDVIEDYAFRKCSQLESFTLPRMTLAIEKGTFIGCKNLKDLILHDKLEIISYSAFADCSSLKSIILPESVKTINNEAFFRCEGLESVSLPNQLTTIGKQTFAGCISLKEVKFPEKLTDILPYAFSGCQSLTEVIFPQTLDDIGANAFLNCSSLKRAVLPPTVEFINYGAFSRCYALDDIGDTKIVEYGDFAFTGNRALKVHLAKNYVISKMGFYFPITEDGPDVIFPDKIQSPSFELDRIEVDSNGGCHESYSVKKDCFVVSFEAEVDRDGENMSRILDFVKAPTYENLIRIKETEDKMLLAAAFNEYDEKFIDYTKKYTTQMLDYISKTNSYYLLDYMLDKKIINKRTINKAVEYAAPIGGELYATLIGLKNEMGVYDKPNNKRLEL